MSSPSRINYFLKVVLIAILGAIHMTLCITVSTYFGLLKGNLLVELISRYWVLTRGVILPIYTIIKFPIWEPKEAQKEYLHTHIKYVLQYEYLVILPVLWQVTVGTGYKEEEEDDDNY